MITLQKLEDMIDESRNRQFKSTNKMPEMARIIQNQNDITISTTTVVSNNVTKVAYLVSPKNIEDFKEFKQWAEQETIPSYCKQCDEYQRDCGIVLWDGMPLCNVQSWSSMIIRIEANIEASGEDIISLILKYYSI